MKNLTEFKLLKGNQMVLLKKCTVGSRRGRGRGIHDNLLNYQKPERGLKNSDKKSLKTDGWGKQTHENGEEAISVGEKRQRNQRQEGSGVRRRGCIWTEYVRFFLPLFAWY